MKDLLLCASLVVAVMFLGYVGLKQALPTQTACTPRMGEEMIPAYWFPKSDKFGDYDYAAVVRIKNAKWN